MFFSRHYVAGTKTVYFWAPLGVFSRIQNLRFSVIFWKKFARAKVTETGSWPGYGSWPSVRGMSSGRLHSGTIFRRATSDVHVFAQKTCLISQQWKRNRRSNLASNSEPLDLESKHLFLCNGWISLIYCWICLNVFPSEGTMALQCSILCDVLMCWTLCRNRLSRQLISRSEVLQV